MSVNSNNQRLVERWIADQKSQTPLLPSFIARELRGRVDVLDVADILVRLNESGMIRRGFAVRVPSGPVLRRVYHSLDEIEPVVRDQLNRPVPRDELEVLPAFEKVGA